MSTGASQPIEIRLGGSKGSSQGIVGTTFSEEATLNIPNAYEHPLFNGSVDKATGYITRSILSIPLRRHFAGELKAVGVVQFINRISGSVPTSPKAGDERDCAFTLERDQNEPEELLVVQNGSTRVLTVEPFSKDDEACAHGAVKVAARALSWVMETEEQDIQRESVLVDRAARNRDQNVLGLLDSLTEKAYNNKRPSRIEAIVVLSKVTVGRGRRGNSYTFNSIATRTTLCGSS